jgi:TonB family protein
VSGAPSCSSSFRACQTLLGTLFLTVLLLCGAPGQAQESGRKVIKRMPVTYPPILKTKGIGGIVRLKVFVKPDGTVRDTEVLGGNPILAESTQKSVMQWKFSPASSETNLEVSVVFDPHSEN